MKDASYESWGRYPKAAQSAFPLYWTSDSVPFDRLGTVLPRGQGRSYGDACLNDGGTLLLTERLDRFLDFDAETGLILCEAGVTLGRILDLIVPRGFFLPVSPGTRHVSVGGAIANDIHGKNHHRAGTFGRYVTRFEILRSNGEKLVCSPTENPELFRATVGGLGLTGLILWAEIRLKPIAGPWIALETIPFSDLEEFFAISRESDRGFEYTVAWLDGFSAGRGLFFRGNHAEAPDGYHERGECLSVPFDFPQGVLNRAVVKAFNALYGDWNANLPSPRRVSLDAFFYPLDAVGRWNRVYGKRGFLQYQCVVPEGETGRRPIQAIWDSVAGSGLTSFLAVLKVFGSLESSGMLSFPRPGVTLALDFPMVGERLLRFLDELDEMVLDFGGCIYPGKDARMSAATFQAGFPHWRKFAGYIDPQFSSGLWRRVTAS